MVGSAHCLTIFYLNNIFKADNLKTTFVLFVKNLLRFHQWLRLEHYQNSGVEGTIYTTITSSTRGRMTRNDSITRSKYETK